MKRLVGLFAAVLLVCSFIPSVRAGEPPKYLIGEQLPEAMVGVHYATRIKASGSNALTFSFVPGDYAAHRVPKGLSLNKEGVLYGTPGEAGTFSFVIQAEDKVIPATATMVFTLRVREFDQGVLKTGGSDAAVIGSGADDLTGVANAVNGGIAAMGKGLLFYVDSKGYLMESRAPFTKADRTYGAVLYANLDTLDDNLYYFHHYLSERGEKAQTFTIVGRGKFTIPATKSKYVTRIVEDTIARKGRIPLILLDNKISSLSVTEQLVMYIDSGLMRRVSLNNGNLTTMRVYANGRETNAESVFPFNGYAYFISSGDRLLYRVPLDGQVAEQLTQSPVTNYTAALWQGEPVLYCSDAQNRLFRLKLDGGGPEEVLGIRAGALNADNTALYFTNPADQFKVYRMAQDTGLAEPVSASGARSIHVFGEYLAYEPISGNQLYIVPLQGGNEARLNR